MTATSTSVAPTGVSDTARSIIRSLTPWVLSGTLALATRLGFSVDPQVSAELFAGIGAVLTIGLRSLEARYPWVGKLLGFSGAPTYPPTKKQQAALEAAAQTALIAELQAKVAELQAANTVPTPAPIEAPVVA